MVCQRPGLDNRSLICQSVFTLIDRHSRLSLALLFCFSLHRVLYLLVFLVTASLSDCLFDLTVKKKEKRKLWLLEFPVHNPHTFDPTHITRAGFRPGARGSVGGKVIHVPGCQSNRSYRLHHNLDSAVGHQFWNLTPRERSAFTFPSNPSCSQVPLDYTSACNISVLSPSAKTKPALVRKQIPFLKQASSSFTAVALYFFIFAGSDRVGGARLSQRGRFCFLAPKREDEIWLNLATLGTSHPAVESKDDTPDNQVHTCCELIYKICSVGLLKNYSH